MTIVCEVCGNHNTVYRFHLISSCLWCHWCLSNHWLTEDEIKQINKEWDTLSFPDDGLDEVKE